MPPEVWVERKARGTYRDRSWETSDMVEFNGGDSVKFDPFPQSDWIAVFCTFVQYVDEEERIAEIRVPPTSERGHPWFNERPGNYYVHQRYLTPQ
jgi:hypothetical protein